MNDPIRWIPVSDIKTDPTGDDLARSEAMRPYIEFVKAAMQKRNTDAALQKIASMSLEERYVWRVLSALHWAFADFDSGTMAVDLGTLQEPDRLKVREFLGRIFPAARVAFTLKTLLGEDQMERLMRDAIRIAKGDSESETVTLTP